jgi:hypothetical protein
VLDPRNTTSTAAYVAVETSASIVVTRIPNVKTAINKSTDADIVIKLFFVEGSLAMIKTGPMRKMPPTVAVMNRHSRSTNAETSFGDLPSANSRRRAARSSREYVNHAGRLSISAERSASTLLSASSRYE